MEARFDQAPEKCMYERLLGPAFSLLPERLQAFHRKGGKYRGAFTVRGGKGRLHRSIARAMDLPAPIRAVAVELEVSRDGQEGETWTRRFGEHEMVTHQRAEMGLLVESIGRLEFRFHVSTERNGMLFEQKSCRYGNTILPRFLAPRIAARATGREDGWDVEVAITMPLLGVITRYEGTLS